MTRLPPNRNMKFPRIVLAILSFLAFFCLGLALPVDLVDTNSTSIESRQYTVWPVSWPGANAVGCVPSLNLNDCFFGSSKWYSDKWAAVQAWDHNCVLLGSNDRIDSEQTFDFYSQLPYTMVAKYSNAQSRPSMAYA
jgi:hypothetical protein